MKKATLLSMLVFAATLTFPAHSRVAMKKDAPPNAAGPESQVVLDSWNNIGRKLIAMAEDFPEEKYDFKPNPAERTFAETLLHVAEANYYFVTFLNPAQGPPIEGGIRRDAFKNKSEIVSIVKKSFAAGASAIQARGEKGLSDLVVDPSANQQVRVLDLAYGFIEHSGEHYGQLGVYYRVAGLVPPESRPKK